MRSHFANKLRRIAHPKIKNSVKSFTHPQVVQAQINFFCTKDDILNNMCNQTVDGPHWLEHNTMEVSGVHQLFG